MVDQHTGGTWREGTRQGGANIYGAVVSDVKPSGHERTPAEDAAEVEAYGGYLIAESIAPQDRPIIAAAPRLLAALRDLVNEIIAYGGAEDAIAGAFQDAQAAIAQATGIGQNVDVRA